MSLCPRGELDPELDSENMVQLPAGSLSGDPRMSEDITLQNFHDTSVFQFSR